MRRKINTSDYVVWSKKRLLEEASKLHLKQKKTAVKYSFAIVVSKEHNV